MNSKQTKSDPIAELGKKVNLQKLHLERFNPLYLIASGAVILLILAIMLFAGGTSQKDNEDVLKRAQQSMAQVGGVVQNFRRLLKDRQVQELAVIAASNPDKLTSLQQYISGRVPDLIDIKLFEPNLNQLRAADLGAYGYAVLDMLMAAERAGLAPAQIHGQDENAYLAMTVRVGEAESPAGYLMVTVKPDNIISAFAASLPEDGVFALDQFNGRSRPNQLSNMASPPGKSERVFWVRIPDSLLRVGVIQAIRTSNSGGFLPALMLVIGLV
ncbi:MAG: hypothetical protein GQ538_00140, partial [Xanthomonadales bacterium]|nr:hypothetical protein [Xanthomonadales bacterium]